MPRRVVAMIPARSGSKGLPGKNVKELCGRPLMYYSIQPALDCALIDAVYVNSDSQEYLSTARSLGAQVYHRPPELATDTAAMGPVVQDFHQSLAKEGEVFDAVLVLYPVYPLRTADELARIVAAFFEAGGDRPMIGLKPAKTHPFLCYTHEEDGRIRAVVDFDINIYFRRQTYPVCYEITYYACMVPTRGIQELNAQLQNDKTVGYRINAERAVDIDGPQDFLEAERILCPDRQ